MIRASGSEVVRHPAAALNGLRLARDAEIDGRYYRYYEQKYENHYYLPKIDLTTYCPNNSIYRKFVKNKEIHIR